ncbi:unnamed protein product [Spirodela intermedia]|uniref:Dof zinc finger protein n=1 Tax=Spirodela intermedia TaxID=51605 RepID=A0A7I8KR06_SPIIN|nr:unnamed protein product [Spirodela intermedia]
MEPYSFLQSPTPSMAERRWNPAVIWAPRCPRCESSNTKFCYYNNYSLSQPRYFCKACRRYWTAGGALRNVPVGGATRRRSRPKPPAGRPHSRPPVLSEPGGAATMSLPPVECPSDGSASPKLAFTKAELEVDHPLGRPNVGSYDQETSTQMRQEQPAAGEELPWPSLDVMAEETLLLDDLRPYSVDFFGATPAAEELAYDEVFWSGSPTDEDCCP